MKHGLTQRWFTKTAENALDRKKNAREYAAQRFFSRLALSWPRRPRFLFLRPVRSGNTLRYPNIAGSATWLGELVHNRYPSSAPRLPQRFFSTFIELQQALATIPFAKIPSVFRREANERARNVARHLTNDGRYLRTHRLVSQDYLVLARTYLKRFGAERRFQHHDVVPWHCASLRGQGLVLFHSGWSGWSFRYYDIAYFMLQMVGFGNRPDETLRLYRVAKRAFRDDPQFADLLLTALLYRSVRLMRELHEGKRPADSRRVRVFMEQMLRTLISQPL